MVRWLFITDYIGILFYYDRREYSVTAICIPSIDRQAYIGPVLSRIFHPHHQFIGSGRNGGR